MDRSGLQGFGPACDCMPLRLGHLHTRHGGEWSGRRCTAGHLDQGGVYLEEARKIKAVALDKTGTITEGKPKLVAFEPIAPDEPEQRVELLAKSLAARSDHPVSKAIAQGLALQAQEVEAFEAVAGRGVQGVIDGHPYILANHRWIEERGQCSATLEARLAVHEEAGRTVTIFGQSGPGDRALRCSGHDQTVIDRGHFRNEGAGGRSHHVDR